ncbi:MAG: autotransporter-associated beta strand repeat-containing protein [Gemmataceae bacterium]
MTVTGPARGQTDYYWNEPAGGAGNWNLALQNWATSIGGTSDQPWLNNGLLRANFGGTAGGVVTLDAGGITAFGVNFTTTGYTLNGGPLTLAGTGGPISTGTGVTATINSVITGSVGLTKSGAGTLIIGTASTYTGDTAVSAGTLRAGAANVFVAGSAYSLTNAAGVILDLNSTDQTIGSLAGGGATGGNVALGTGTLTLGGTNASTTFSGLFTGTGTIIKNGSGVLTLAGNSTWTGPLTINGGVVSIDSTTRLNNTSGTGTVTLNGGTLRQTNAGNGGTFIRPNRTIDIGPLGGTVDFTSSNSTNAILYRGTITGPGNTLTKVGPSEFRFLGDGTATANYGKLVVNEGLFRLGNEGANAETGFGAAPASPLADAITLNGATAAIGTSFVITLNANRGITLGPAGGIFNVSSGTMTVPSVITGSGALNKTTAGTLVLSGANTYTGATNITAGSLEMGAVNTLPATSTIQLGGGTLRTRVTLGATTGFSQNTGLLDLNANSFIALGTGSHVLNFSGLDVNPTGTLTISGWTGGQNQTGTAGQIVFNSNANFSQTFLDSVQFSGFTLGATLIPFGGAQFELVPAPEPATVLAAASAGLGLVGAVRRVRRRKAAAQPA